MSSLFASLNSTASTIAAFETALSVTQNNIANSATPGYVEQIPTFEALPFDSRGGAVGGVTGGAVGNARNIYAENAVQQAQTSLGTWNGLVNTLQGLQTSFNLTGTSGIPGALNALFSAFSTWGTSPNDATAQQSVLDAAQGVGQAFQQQAAAISTAATSADSNLNNLVTQVNTLTARIQQDNVQTENGGSSDPAVQADLYNNLEQLSAIVPITALNQSNGTTTVLLGGETPLVIGAQQYQIGSSFAVPQNPFPTYPSAPPNAQILDSNGNDITSQITTGQIGGVLQALNGTLAQLQGSANQQGSLNQLAQTIADRVNELLTGGNISDADPNTGAPAVPGVPLFSYDPNNPAGVAASLSVNPAITPSQLAAINPGPPEVDNGIPLALANLATPQSPFDEIDNMSYTQFYGNMAAQLGTAISTGQNNQTTSQEALTQSQSLRQHSSGVDLNQEAIKVLQFQQSYDAVSKIVTILDQVSKDFLDAIQMVT